ncbi:MAG: signal recognition particle receptor subunit alpha, partial [Kiritimatiellia bacterium]
MKSWFQALDRTRKQLSGALGRLFTGTASVDDETLEDLEARLMQADLPVKLALELVETLREEGIKRGEDAVRVIREQLIDALGSADV